MKRDIHPPYQGLKIVIGKDTFNTFSTIKSGQLLMDTDYRQHPAWTKKRANYTNDSSQDIANFNKKFAGLFGIVKKAE